MVIATRNRAPELLRTLARLDALDERPPVIVVDNGSWDGTPAAVARRAPRAEVLALPANIGAAARTVGVRRARTPFVAFADDDSWWAPSALARAAALLRDRRRAGLVAARIVVEPAGDTDPTCGLMAASPLGPPDGAPASSGLRSVLGFLACGAVVRREAFLAVGGFRPGFGVGGEEALLSIDLAAAGWELVYDPSVVAHHQPSAQRAPSTRHRREVRNALWTAWARRRPGPAVRRSWAALRGPGRIGPSVLGAADALVGAGWVVRHRAVVPACVEAALTVVERGTR